MATDSVVLVADLISPCLAKRRNNITDYPLPELPGLRLSGIKGEVVKAGFVDGPYKLSPADGIISNDVISFLFVI